ncbi:MAG: hypothetical protein ACREJC_07405 [Tepidisphaeraceae bacterium]
MTKLLEEAFSQASKLPPEEQDAVAARLLQELADDRQWDDAFEKSQDQIAKMAKKVRRDVQTGKTRQVGIDEL